MTYVEHNDLQREKKILVSSKYKKKLSIRNRVGEWSRGKNRINGFIVLYKRQNDPEANRGYTRFYCPYDILTPDL